MTPFRDVRRARTHRYCDECGGVIPQGVRYVRLALPPQKDPNYSDRWNWLTFHGGCVRPVLAEPSDRGRET